ncbi:MAG TPA: hypothetical protein VF121_02980 [Thermoanaerobaculia bacterium]|nr:hypothetical protein [Thermoanaerobaculia bacterium]
MTRDLFVTGGEQRLSFVPENEWSRYTTALVVRVRDGVPERVFQWHTPPDRLPEGGGSHCFKAATFTADTAYLCSQTEVLICDLPGFVPRRVISLPCFNDLHHVVPGPEGTLWVTVTGLDAVAEVSPEGELLRLVGVLGASPWERFSPDVDYRKVPTTKPHASHPNYVFFLDGRPYVTRFEQRDAVPLDGGEGPRFLVGGAGIHDGNVAGGGVAFTSVDGHVTRFEPDGGRRSTTELNLLAAGREGPLGWCRGLHIEEQRAWVGFTRIRQTRLRQNLSWVRHGFRRAEHSSHLPTRVALYDLAAPAALEEVDLEPVGLNAVFSIHAAS